MNLCKTCHRILDTGNVRDANCGGDCTVCMAAAGDPDCQHRLNEDLLKKVYTCVNEQTKDWPPTVDAEARQYLTETARFWRRRT